MADRRALLMALAAGNDVVIDEVEPRQVNILRVIHAARDWGVLV